MSELVVCNVTVFRDSSGRYRLNDLHRAAGGQPGHRPGEWMRNKQAQELIAELGGAGIPAGPVGIVNDGFGNGTYVCKELVYAYAMWISASFSLRVIRAYDGLVSVPSAPVFALPQTMAEALRLAADQSEKAAAAEAALAIAAPKAEALDRLSDATRSVSVTEAAKYLQVAPRWLFDFLRERGWAYNRSGRWLAMEGKTANGGGPGYVENRIVEVFGPNGAAESPRSFGQLRITPKGLTKLSAMINDLNASTVAPAAAVQ